MKGEREVKHTPDESNLPPVFREILDGWREAVNALKPCWHCGAEHDAEKCPLCGRPRVFSWSDSGSKSRDYPEATQYGPGGKVIKEGE